MEEEGEKNWSENLVRILKIPKYLKRKENDISKANKKSKHKHQYEECLIRYKWNWDEHKIHTSLNSYCTICGKINDKMKNSIVIDYMQKVDTPVGKRYRQISEDVLYETYHDRLPVFFVEDICKDKCVNLGQVGIIYEYRKKN